MYNTILVPLDGSKLAEMALPYAREFAVKLDSEVTLFRAVALPIHAYPAAEAVIETPYAVEEEKLVEAMAADYLKKAGTRLKAKGITVTSEVRVGPAADRIADYASRGDVGLIVMVTHGRSGVTRWALGSVANKVVRATRRPVILVRAKEARPAARARGQIKRILVPLDGSEESETVVTHVEEITSRFGSKVILLEVLSSGHHVSAMEGYSYLTYPPEHVRSEVLHARSYLEKVADRLQKKGVTTELEIRFGSPAEVIVEMAVETHADLVAMSTHGRSGVGRWIFGSVAEKVLHEGKTPLLLVRSSGTTIK